MVFWVGKVWVCVCLCVCVCDWLIYLLKVWGGCLTFFSVWLKFILIHTQIHTLPIVWRGALCMVWDSHRIFWCIGNSIFLSVCCNWMFCIWYEIKTEKEPTPEFLPGKSHGQRSLVGYSPWGYRVGHDWVTNTQPREIKTPFLYVFGGGGHLTSPMCFWDGYITVLIFHIYDGRGRLTSHMYFWDGDVTGLRVV